MTDNELIIIGKRIADSLRESREKKTLSKNALAQKAGVSVQTVSFIEGGVNSPSITTFLRLCDALGIKPDKILKDALK